MCTRDNAVQTHQVTRPTLLEREQVSARQLSLREEYCEPPSGQDPSLDSRPSVLSTCPEVDIADVSEGWPDSRAVANRLHPDSDLCDTASTITSRHTVGIKVTSVVRSCALRSTNRGRFVINVMAP
jgi:hypothetical protein